MTAAEVPLIPTSVADARDLHEMIRADLASQVGPEVADQLALACLEHLCASSQTEPAYPRLVVLHGTNPLALLSAARAVIASLPGLPATEVPLTFVSEQGWAGQSLAEWLEPLSDSPSDWRRRGVVILTGLECLCMRRGTYSIAKGSGSTQDYRLGKSQNLLALLSGQPLPEGRNDWTATNALMLVTANYDQDGHDAARLDDWGIIPELAGILANANWVSINASPSPTMVAAVVAQHLRPIVDLYAAMGYRLTVTTEAVTWAAQQAAEHDETPAATAARIAHSLRRRLAAMRAAGLDDPRIVVGPDDIPPPTVSSRAWHD